jgi:hypothetical protein
MSLACEASDELHGVVQGGSCFREWLHAVAFFPMIRAVVGLGK